MPESTVDTRSPTYTRYLEERKGWKRWLDVQAPYRWNLRRLELGFTLDLGCGTGRNLAHLGGNGVGVDHNEHSVAAARARGLEAYTNAEFARSPHARPGRFDALLVAHVLEHMPLAEAIALVGEHLPFVRPGGKVVLIAPQEAGFASDATHVAFTGFAELERLLAAQGLVRERRYSFPFPRFVGRIFPHNEFVVVARKPAPAAPAEVRAGRAHPPLLYLPLERLRPAATVERIPYVVERCRGRRVLDLGGYDETAPVKQATEHWLHGRIAAVAASVLGIDSSSAIPSEGLTTGPRSRIVRGDVLALERVALGDGDFDVLVAGELIEHLPDALAFLRRLKAQFPGKELLISTPNATSLANVMLAMFARESNHPDHLQVYSYKTLNTLCLRAGFEAWDIRPYHVLFTEMALRSKGPKRLFVGTAERLVHAGESLFPLLAGGMILHVTKI